MATQGALAGLDIDGSINSIASGVLSKDLAEPYGVAPRTLRAKLARARPEEYKQAVKDQAHALMEKAVQFAIECDHKDDAPIARARLEGAKTWAKAFDAETWGDKQQLTVNTNINVQVDMTEDAASLLDAVRSVALIPKTIDGAARLVSNGHADASK